MTSSPIAPSLSEPSTNNLAPQLREPIAIIGIGCRFPGKVYSPAQFWTLLCDGVDTISEIPSDRWSIDAYYHSNPQVQGRSYSKWGGFLSGVDRFDPEVFGISPREAKVLDPQQRLMLEVSLEAIEDSGHLLSNLHSSQTGVFIGVSTGDYAQLQIDSLFRGEPNPHTATGIAFSIIANRVSYNFNFKGPSMVVDTACSSSLVAVHHACRSLWSGETELTLAGGINLAFMPSNFVAFSNMGMLSKDGRCKAFDASANGFVRGEGAAMVLLKPYSRALADGDRIYALIMNTGVNQDGKTNGLQVPDSDAQATLIKQSYQQVDLNPKDLSYVEMHGTGTAVGDPIEAGALGNVLQAVGLRDQACSIGSVKTNIGHLESAAGIAGLVKTALILKHGLIPPSLHFHTPNPAIDFVGLGLEVQTKLGTLKTDDKLAIAGVNSFGFGGTNCHAVLRQVEQPKQPRHSKSKSTSLPKLLPLSAQSKERLRILANSYLIYLEAAKDEDLADIVYSAACHRGHFEERLCVAGWSRQDLRTQLQTYLSEQTSPNLVSATALKQNFKLAFICSGQGSQWWGMGQQLFNQNKEYRCVLNACDKYTRELAGWSLLDELSKSEQDSQLNDTRYAQPAICALQLGLAAVLQSYGIKPDVVIGHSVGEIAAAQIAGALSLESAMTIAIHRGQLMAEQAGGRMLAVGLSWSEAKSLCQNYAAVSIAAVNSPNSVTLAGSSEQLSDIAKRYENEVFCRFLKVDYAFHSVDMEPVREPLMAALKTVSVNKLKLPMVSTVTGDYLDSADLNAEYWWHNVRQPVLFQPALELILSQPCSHFLELSPHPTLLANITETIKAARANTKVIPSLKRDTDDSLALVMALASMHCTGYPLEWKKVLPKGRFISLPTYPWQRKSFWNETLSTRLGRLPGKVHPLLGVAEPPPDKEWKSSLDLNRLAYLKEHRLQGKALFPASGFIETSLVVSRETFDIACPVLENIEFKTAFFISEDFPLSNLLTRVDELNRDIKLYSWDSGSAAAPTLHCSTRVGSEEALPPVDGFNPDNIIKRCDEYYQGSIAYELNEETDLDYGSSFHAVDEFWRNATEAIAKIIPQENIVDDAEAYLLHPTVLDACLQVFSLNRPLQSWRENPITFVPVRADEVRFYQQPKNSFLWAHVVKHKDSLRHYLGDLFIYDEVGKPVMCILGLESRGLEAKRSANATQNEWLYKLEWQIVPSKSLHADFLPSLNNLNDAIKRSQGISATGSAANLHEELTNVATDYLIHALIELGISNIIGQTLQPHALAKKLNINPPELLISWKSQLLKRNLICEDENGWQINEVTAEVSRATQSIRKMLSEAPAYASELILSSRAGRNLANVLRGGEPMELLAPGGNKSFLEHLWRDAPSFKLRNQLASQVVQEILNQLPKGRALNILIIGSDTSGVTARILESLKSTSFCIVTETDAEALAALSSSFKTHQTVRYELLDLSQDPREQGFKEHSFELIIAAGALVYSVDPQKSLSNLQTLLASEGILIQFDSSQAAPWLQLLLGLAFGHEHFALPANIPELLDESFPEVTELRILPELWRKLEPAELANNRIWIAHHSRVEKTLTEPSQEANVEKEHWILLADQLGMGECLRKQLLKQGISCDFIPSNRGEMLAESLLSSQQIPSTIVYFWALDCTAAEDLSLERFIQDEQLTCHSVIELIRTIDEHWTKTPPRLVFVTLGARSIEGDQGLVSVAQSPIFGMIASATIEYPHINFQTIDLNSEEDFEVQAQRLFDEIDTELTENELVLRADDQRFVPRIRQFSKLKNNQGLQEKPLAKQRFQLQFPRQGSVENLVYQESIAPVLSADQVEVKVISAGLNFRDVLKVLGLYPTEGNDYLQLGDECAGVITAVGENVKAFKPGDEVIALGASCFASHLVTHEDLLIPKPKHLSFEEAATLPIAFLTAFYCLHEVARLKPNERILIHAAAGGVGLASVQLAQAIGARVFATASQGKRDLLDLMAVGKVMNSRSLAFAEEIRNCTQGAGVNVILNSLSGEALLKSLALIAPYGRFVEIGKRDIFQDRQIGLRTLRKNASFHAVDLSQLMNDQPKLIKDLQQTITQKIQQSQIRPLPYRVFPASRISEAFQAMIKGSHTGKLIISMKDPQLHVVPLDKEVQLQSQASYLISGGFGGFGLEIARSLLRKGARNLVLLGRRGANSEQAKAAMDEFSRIKDAQVLPMQADVSKADEVEAVIKHIEANLPPLRGIVHAAMVLEDEPLAKLSARSLRRVMAPKVDGVWNLHHTTKHLPLDFFFLTSSIASLLGNAGQASYSAANAFLDHFAAYRHALGLPASAINWGPLAEVGVVANNAAIGRRLDFIGLKSLSTHRAIGIFERFLGKQEKHLAAFHVDMNAWQAAMGYHKLPSKFEELIVTDTTGTQQSNQELHSLVLNATGDTSLQLVADYLCDQLAKVIGIPQERIDRTLALQNIGLDSLMTVELHHRLETELDITIPTAAFAKNPSVHDLAKVVVDALYITQQVAQDSATSITQPQLSTQALQLLKSGKEQLPPLFCCNSADGDLLLYRDLVMNLLTEQEIYGLYLPSQAEKVFASVQDMAKAYVALIKNRQPKGSVYLLGYSFGSIVATELAYQLEQAGTHVAFLGLVEPSLVAETMQLEVRVVQHYFEEWMSSTPAIANLAKDIPTKEKQRLLNHLARTFMATPEEDRSKAMIEYFLNNEFFDEASPVTEIENRLRTFLHHVNLALKHPIRTLETTAQIWITQATAAKLKENDLLLHAPENASSPEALAGHHFSIMTPPEVNILAEHIAKVLQATPMQEE